MYFHTVKVLFHSVTLGVGWNWFGCSSIMYYKKLWALEKRHISGHPCLISAPVVWRNFTVWRQKHMWSTVSQHVLKFYWRKQLFVWEVKINECLLNKTKDGDRFQVKEDGYMTCFYPRTGCWCGGEIQVPRHPQQEQNELEDQQRRCIQEKQEPSTCAANCWRCFISLLCSLLLCAGGTASGLVAPTEWINWWGMLAPWLAASWTFLKLWREATHVFLHLTCHLKFMFFFVDFKIFTLLYFGLISFLFFFIVYFQFRLVFALLAPPRKLHWCKHCGSKSFKWILSKRKKISSRGQKPLQLKNYDSYNYGVSFKKNKKNNILVIKNCFI